MKNKFFLKVLLVIMVLLSMQSVSLAAKAYYLTSSGFKIYPVQNIDWFKEKKKYSFICTKGKVYTVMDVDTGIWFKIRNRSSDKHIDFEPLTAEDTAKICKAYGAKSASKISAQRRAMLLTYGEYTFACSMYAQPHVPKDQTITNNNFDGVACLHFLNSTTSDTKVVQASHQNAVKKAYNYALKKKPNTGISTNVDVTSITASVKNSTINVGDSVSISTTIKPTNATNKSLKYTSSNAKIAKVDANGKITGVASGTANITVTSVSNAKATKTIKIKVVNNIKSIKLSGADKLYVGKSTKVSATITPTKPDDATLTWSSSNAKIAKVDSNGNVTGISKGTVTITAQSKANSSVKGTIKITILENKASSTVVDVKSVKISVNSKKLTVGDSMNASCTITPNNATNKGVKYTSSNAKVAKVDANGKITAVSAGTATITVTSTSNAKASDNVKITIESKSTSTPTPTPTQNFPTADEMKKMSAIGTVTATSSVNLRKGPGKSYSKVGNLSKNKVLQYVTTYTNGNEKWYGVKISDNSYGWVLSNYVKVGKLPTEPTKPTTPSQPTTPDTTTGKVKVISSKVNIRKGAGTSYARLGTLTQNTIVKYTATKNVSGTTWYNIETSSGTKGWVMGSYVKVVS